MNDSNHTSGGVHTVKETDTLVAKIDLLLKKIDDYSQDKA